MTFAKTRFRKSAALLVAMIIGVLPTAPALGAESDPEYLKVLDSRSTTWRLTGGIGYGMLNSGYGLNFGVSTANSFSYLSVGCEKFASIEGCDGTQAIGHFRTDLIRNNENRNALGFYGGRLARKNTGDSVYGVGVGYVFFSDGISGSGFTAGIGYEIGRSAGSTNHHRLAVQLGVQF